MNILQVKERGATTIVITNLENIYKHIGEEKINYLITLTPQPSMLAALLCCPPLLMVCYFTALAKGINPDENMFEAINIQELKH